MEKFFSSLVAYSISAFIVIGVFWLVLTLLGIQFPVLFWITLIIATIAMQPLYTAIGKEIKKRIPNKSTTK